MRVGDEIEPRLAWNARIPDEHEAWRVQFAAKLRQLLGREPERVPLEVEWDEEKEFDAFTRRKVYVRTEEHYWAPAFLFIPKGLKRPAPAIVCLHGHSGVYPYIREGKPEDRAHHQELELDYPCRFAEQGYVTLAPIQRGWNETAESVPKGETGCQRMVMDALFVGMTPIGQRCWDASRLLDFLQTQDVVDSDRIGVAGLSGGGTVSMFWSAVEDRIGLTMIAGHYCTFRNSAYAIRHCLCNCVPHMMEWGEMREVTALIAPRPLLVISGTGDPIFPIEATQRAYDELRKVYELLGAGGNLDKDIFEGGHAWSNRKAPAFVEKHFGPPRRG